LKFNRLGAFTLGVVITAVSVGAVSFVNAAGDKTLKACANKKTGVMRYISKGSCNKKTETSMSWNQMGPTGLSGSAGTNGTAGANGTNGSAGAKGEVGPAGQNFHAIDATGKDLGIITQGNASEVTVYSEGGLWPWQTHAYAGNNYVYLFRDSSCTVPLATYTNAVVAVSSFVFPSTTRWILAKSAQSLPTVAYKASGQAFDIYSLTTVYVWDAYHQTCTSRNPTTFYAGYENVYATDLTTVSLPTYTAPLTIVAK
jgi:hypothetical protein